MNNIQMKVGETMKIEEIICAVSIVILGVIGILAWIIGKCLSNKSEKITNDKLFVIRLPKSMLIIGVTGILVPFLILLGMILFDEDASSGSIIFAFSFFVIMMFAGIYLIVTTLLHKIIIQGNKITVYPIIKKAYTVEFKDIVSVKIVRLTRGERVVVRTESKKFSVECDCIGYERFLKLIYRKVSQGKIIIK